MYIVEKYLITEYLGEVVFYDNNDRMYYTLQIQYNQIQKKNRFFIEDEHGWSPDFVTGERIMSSFIPRMIKEMEFIRRKKLMFLLSKMSDGKSKEIADKWLEDNNLIERARRI